MRHKYRAAFAMGRGCSWGKAGTFNERQSIAVTDIDAWIDGNLRAEQYRV